jgi:hypothetical protein
MKESHLHPQHRTCSLWRWPSLTQCMFPKGRAVDFRWASSVNLQSGCDSWVKHLLSGLA